MSEQEFLDGKYDHYSRPLPTPSTQELLDELERIKEFVKNCTPEKARELMVKAGISNPDGTLTDRYK